ncbi:MAG: tetratricopeptide repeat protein, partial [Pseudomonadales bacterium]|nr:tetratricopeptide repeat protein [Pseudomonadales bacterium]
PASLLQAQIYEMMQRNADALNLLHQQLHRYPDADLLRQNEAALLIRMSRNSEAETDYMLLAQRHPLDGDFWLAHALLAMQNQHLTAASQSLHMLLQLQEHENDAHYYLGQIEVFNHNNTAALNQFDAVTAGPDYLPALQASASLREKLNQIPQALAFINQALSLHPEYYAQLIMIESDLLMSAHNDPAAATLLEDGLHRFPDNTDLLYARAMLAVDQNDLQKFETDIRKVLAKEPHNPVALNALGYTLADRTNRYQEALAYIQEALKLTPKDPAIIDSMGWVEYRLGHREQAETLLRQAWDIIHDDEIGSHYGEVLWVMGQKDEANKVWQESLKTNPRSPFIPATRKRLGAS